MRIKGNSVRMEGNSTGMEGNSVRMEGNSVRMGGNGIRIEGLRKSYGDHQIFKNLTMELREGGRYALMGPSGAGKTTLLHILMGLTSPDGGTLSGLSQKRISPVFQENRLCEFLTAAENIAIIRPHGSLRDRASLKDINRCLTEILPEESLDRLVSTYSGGMKRRAAIARALLTDSDMVILDEPFSGLDQETRRTVADFILKYRRDRTLLFTTHEEEDVSLLGAELIFLENKLTPSAP